MLSVTRNVQTTRALRTPNHAPRTRSAFPTRYGLHATSHLLLASRGLALLPRVRPPMIGVATLRSACGRE